MRVAVFGGAAVVAMVLLSFPVEFHLPILLGVIWVLGLMMVTMAEHEVGWPPLSFAALFVGAGLFALMLWTQAG